ncbi:hypothetical protein ACET3Z_003816 [Daucus carota]
MWESFWPRFCSAKPTIDDAMATLASVKEQGATSSQRTPPETSQWKDGNQPMNVTLKIFPLCQLHLHWS